MPKDKIEDATQTAWHVEVSWRRKPDGDDRGTAEGHVQLATINLHSPFEFPDVETEGHFEAGERFDGWRVTLDEATIDRLIKTLHKAKRQAFGPTRPIPEWVADFPQRGRWTVQPRPIHRSSRPCHTDLRLPPAARG